MSRFSSPETRDPVLQFQTFPLASLYGPSRPVRVRRHPRPSPPDGADSPNQVNLLGWIIRVSVFFQHKSGEQGWAERSAWRHRRTACLPQPSCAVRFNEGNRSHFHDSRLFPNSTRAQASHSCACSKKEFAMVFTLKDAMCYLCRS